MKLVKGSHGPDVAKLQVMLNAIMLPQTMLLCDGGFGQKTESLLNEYIAKRKEQGKGDYFTDDTLLWGCIVADFAKCKKMVVVVDAGHGGIHPETKQYMTPAENGKRFSHKGAKLHLGSDTFFEGYENRIIADEVVKRLKAKGILAVPCYHPYLDWYNTNSNGQELERRGYFVEPYLQAGYKLFCYHSFHSNAAPTSLEDKAGNKRKRTKEELDAISYGVVYTTKGLNASDGLSKDLLNLWQADLGDAFTRFYGEKDEVIATEQSDYEENFGVISAAERMGKKYGVETKALLEEFDFYTSEPGAKRITDPEIREKRVQCALKLYESEYAKFCIKYP